jgi:hypothetical protein
MSEQNTVENEVVDYLELSKQVKNSHVVAKESQNNAKWRRGWVPALVVSGLTSVVAGISAERYQPIAVGTFTEAAALVVYGQSRRQERGQGIIAVGAALYQQRLAEIEEKGTPTWATREIADASPTLISNAIEVIAEVDRDRISSITAGIQEWVEPAPE